MKFDRLRAEHFSVAMKRTFSVFLALCMLSGGTLLARADDTRAAESIPESTVTAQQTSLEKKYRDAVKSFSFSNYTGQDLTYEAASALTSEGAAVDSVDGYGLPVVALAQGEDAAFAVSVPENGLYQIGLEYYDVSDSTLPITCAVMVDGAYSYYEMRNQQFDSDWVYESEDFSTDRYGNEIVPQSVRVQSWQTVFFKDSSAITMESFAFELTAGEHRLFFHCSQGAFYLGKILITAIREEAYDGETGTPSGERIVTLEAEHFTSKNNASVRPSGEYDANIYPYDYSKLKLNMLSGSSFSSGGQSVTYSFETEESGFYYLGFKYRQNAKTDFPVFRTIYLDGKLYSTDFKNVPFPYSKSFSKTTVSNENGDPIGVYLEAGVTHTLTLSVSLENVADLIDDVNELIDEINDTSLKIIKVTGNNTSVYRDFDVLSYIPTIQDDLNGWADRVEDIYDRLAVYSPDVKTIGEYSTLKICVKQLRSLASDLSDLPNRINELYQGDSSVGQYLANTLESLYKSPLSIDQIYFYQDASSLPKNKNIFYRFGMSCCRFLSSFTNDYYAADDDSDAEHLNVWVNRSRLYIELMQKMADDDFFAKTGVTADISIMPNEEKLVLASASGNAPDVALGVTYTIPFELSIRGAIKELSSYPDFGEVASRFGKGIIQIGAVDGGYYVLPETSDFLVLFYRQDILDELGLTVPNTMEEVKKMLPVLKRYGMDFYSHIAGHSGTKTLSVLVPFIYQMQGRIYGRTASELLVTSDAMVSAFQEMSDLFTIYDIPYEISNFYQHFRSGDIPLGISGFNTYMTLLNSAPEIANSWGVAPYPGYQDENGEVLRYISGAHATAVIFESTEHPEESWEFLKWWMSADIQSEFAETLRLTYGNEYMWNTANLEAFERLPWNEEHKEVILEMLDWIVEVPRVPGTYMTQRSLSNALNNIVLSNANVRQELAEAEKDIRAEIYSKLEEFGYIKDGETVKEFKVAAARAEAID